jgi:hypothetical protein
MYYGVYTPWDHAPKFLRQSEVRDPLIILKGFFDGNDVDAHIARLKNWRRYVVSSEYYNDERFGPGNLIYDYEQNVRFIEAIFLLLLNDHEPSFGKEKIASAQLITEKEAWSWYPGDFTEKELLNPYLVVKTAFDEISPQAFRDYLWEWFEAALSSGPLDETTSPAEIITVYEHLVKLFAAAWMIFQRQTNKQFLEEPVITTYEVPHVADEKKAAAMPDRVIKNVSIKATPAQKLGLKEVTKLILKTNPYVQLVCHFETSEDPFIFFLLIVVDNVQELTNDEIAVKMEHDCAHLVNIIACVKKRKWFEKGSRKSSSFYYYAFRLKDITYESVTITIPEYPEQGPYMTQQEIGVTWDRYGSLAHELYFKALEYQEANNQTDCLTTLKQSMNQSLKVLIAMKTGFEPATDDHNRLFKMSLMCTKKIWQIFYKPSDSSIKAMRLLDQEEPLLNNAAAQAENETALNILMLNAYLLLMIAREEYIDLMHDVHHHAS